MKRVKVCPFCKSTSVGHDTSNPLEGALGLPERFVCYDCGHTGYTFPEMPAKEVKKYRKATKKPPETHKEKVDVSYGNFEVRAVWKASGPAAVVLGLILFTITPITGTLLVLAGVVMVAITYGEKRSLR